MSYRKSGSKSDEAPKLTRLAIAGYAALLVGLVLVLLGISWKQLVPDKVFWSEADAKQWTEATAEIHAARSTPHNHNHNHSHGGESAGAEDIDFEKAKANLAEVERRLQNARTLRGSTGKVLSIVGVVLAIVGAGILRRSAD